MTGRGRRSNITPEFLLMAYRHGFFPMADSRSGPIGWYSPDPRAILPLDAFNVSRSLRRTLRKQVFDIRVNTAFDEVIRGCANRPETWISEEIIALYRVLHTKGFAHCVESWREGRLVGGLYGVALGAAFFGESMFSLEPDSSKVALAWLVDHLRARGYRLLDTQFMNEHIRQFGAIEISRPEYLARLAEALEMEVVFWPGREEPGSS